METQLLLELRGQEALREGGLFPRPQSSADCRGWWTEHDWIPHLVVWQEDRWRAGTVQDVPAAHFPHATPNVWTVFPQNLKSCTKRHTGQVRMLDRDDGGGLLD